MHHDESVTEFLVSGNVQFSRSFYASRDLYLLSPQSWATRVLFCFLYSIDGSWQGERCDH